jgi:16S rRNA C967 or C1407 C5-methylase (RsmB/RsmF family)
MRGDIMLQSLASYVAALVLGPAPGSRVLDMCAAPGGKTTAIAQLMGDCGEVVALDQSHRKV